VDIVTGLELGADDYLTKPFSPRVLLSRVKALLRRIQEQAKQGNNSLHRGNLSISLSQHEVRVGEISVDLTGTEFKILVTLAKRPGWVFTRDQIVLSSQGGNAIVTARSVDVHIVSLRRKLGTCGDYIETIRGIGYKFRIPPEQELPE
jgi:two-component system, OmpR family, alkaline phosphatase synthesis response regulator PhoP